MRVIRIQRGTRRYGKYRLSIVTPDDVPDAIFRLLGPVRLERAGQPVELGPGKQCCMLAALLMQPGRPVPVDVLVGQLWDEDPPKGARNALATYATRLRRILEPTGLLQLRYATGGYVADCEPDRVDLHRARRLVRAARQSADPATLLRAALASWEPVALAGVPGEWAARVRDGLRRERLDVLAARVDADLHLGRHAELVEELRAVVTEHPTAEELAGRLMLALAAAGRASEALAHYARLREALADELGSEPSGRLRWLHLRILRDDPALAAGTATLDDPEPPADPPAEPAPGVPGVPRVRTLPRDAADLVGRDDAVRAALALATDPPGDRGTTVLAFDGMPGVGKTALAVHLAHRLADRFPDAQLYVELRGVAAAGEPVSPAGALDTLLRALGVDGGEIPDDLDARTALWRSRIAARRAVIVLDNAAGTEQVERLLPGSGESVTLITSRRRLTDLDADLTWSVDVLPADAATTLFTRLLGAGRPPAEPAATAAVVAGCGRLPLAIRIAASRLRHRPAWTVDSFAARLRAERQRLAELSAGSAGVSAAFALSYRHLGAAEQRAFRRLGLHPGVEVDRRQVAALLGVPAAEAEALLEALVDQHLVEQPATGRYRCHDLLRQYARERAAVDDTEADRLAAVHRLIDTLLCTADAANRLLADRPQQFTLTMTDPVDEPPPATRAEAWRWFTTERPNLVAAVLLAAETGADAAGWQLAHRLLTFLMLAGYFDDVLITQQAGLDAALRAGDPRGEATMRNGLAGTYWRSGEQEEAVAMLLRSVDLFRSVGDQLGVARGFNNLGMMRDFLGRYDEAIDAYRQALAGFQALDDEYGQAGTLNNIGLLLRAQGRYEEAARTYQTGLGFARRIGDLRLEGHLLGNYGAVLGQLGHYQEAIARLRRAVSLREEVNDQPGTATARNDLGSVLRETGRFEEAIEQHLMALESARAAANITDECEICNDLAETLRRAGRSADAALHFRRAIELSDPATRPYEHARAFGGLARLHLDAGEPAAADSYGERALALFEQLGSPDADELRAALAAAHTRASQP
jgi:DNA-binding SARP family transcriptional activator/tetratricopeptide (TPR) repeat protein